MANRLEAALRSAGAGDGCACHANRATCSGAAPDRSGSSASAAPGSPSASAPSYENLQREMANLLGRQSGEFVIALFSGCRVRLATVVAGVVG